MQISNTELPPVNLKAETHPRVWTSWNWDNLGSIGFECQSYANKTYIFIAFHVLLLLLLLLLLLPDKPAWFMTPTYSAVLWHTQTY
jgi:hypothetical protein